MVGKKKSRLKLTLLSLTVTILFCLGNLIYIEHIEKSRNFISDEKLNQAQTIIFYRDDCPDCQKLLPKKILLNILNNKTVFVNLNNQKNKQYINQYNLKIVPTIIEADKK